MFKKKLGVLLAIVVVSLSLFGCGKGVNYNFSDYELTNAMGMPESGMKRAVIDFDKGDVNYNATIENGSRKEYIYVTFNKKSKEAMGAGISADGNTKSKYCIYNVRVGDSSEEAKAAMEAIYGPGTGSESDLTQYWSYTYDDEEHGFVNYVVYKKTGKVSDISMLRR